MRNNTAELIQRILCTAYGFLDHSLKEDCATIQSH